LNSRGSSRREVYPPSGRAYDLKLASRGGEACAAGIGKKRDHPQADAIRLGYLIAAALQGARGREEIAAAERRLYELIARGRFNSARAVKVYANAVDKAVWASLERAAFQAGAIPKLQSERAARRLRPAAIRRV